MADPRSASDFVRESRTRIDDAVDAFDAAGDAFQAGDYRTAADLIRTANRQLTHAVSAASSAILRLDRTDRP